MESPYSSLNDSEVRHSLPKKILNFASQPFEGTSIQRRLISKVKISPIRFIWSIVVGISLGFPILVFGPLVITLHKALSKKEKAKKMPLYMFMFCLIFSLSLAFLNASALIAMNYNHRQLIYLAAYIAVYLPFLVVVLDTAYEYAKDRNMRIVDFMALFAIQNPQIGLFHLFGHRVGDYFEKAYNYLHMANNNIGKFHKEKATYFLIAGVIYSILALGFFATLPSFFGIDDGLFVSICIFSLISTIYYSSVMTIYFEQEKYLEVEAAFEELKKNAFEPEAYITTFENVFNLVISIKASIKKQFFYSYGNVVLIVIYSAAAVYYIFGEGDWLKKYGAQQTGFINFCFIAIVYFSFPSISKIYYGFLINFVFKEISEVIFAVNDMATLLKVRAEGIDFSKENWYESLTSGNKVLLSVTDMEIEAEVLEQKLKSILENL